jgi:hypothetical protein
MADRFNIFGLVLGSKWKFRPCARKEDRPIPLFDVRVLGRLAGSNERQLDASPIGLFVEHLAAEFRPVSTVIDCGRPRVSARRSSTPCTRRPVIEVSTSMAKHSRVQSSTMVGQRKRRPPMSPSAVGRVEWPGTWLFLTSGSCARLRCAVS